MSTNNDIIFRLSSQSSFSVWKAHIRYSQSPLSSINHILKYWLLIQDAIILCFCSWRGWSASSNPEGKKKDADLRQDSDGEDDHAGGGALRHHRERQGQDPGQGGNPPRPAETHLRRCLPPPPPLSCRLNNLMCYYSPKGVCSSKCTKNYGLHHIYYYRN